jgi:hypothetical protein
VTDRFKNNSLNYRNNLVNFNLHLELVVILVIVTCTIYIYIHSCKLLSNFHLNETKVWLILAYISFIYCVIELGKSSVTRYFARQLLNKHAKNYQNVEKITKFLLSTKVVWKSIKHLSKIKSVLYSIFFFLTCNCAKCKYGPGP